MTWWYRIYVWSLVAGRPFAMPQLTDVNNKSSSLNVEVNYLRKGQMYPRNNNQTVGSLSCETYLDGAAGDKPLPQPTGNNMDREDPSFALVLGISLILTTTIIALTSSWRPLELLFSN